MTSRTNRSVRRQRRTRAALCSTDHDRRLHQAARLLGRGRLTKALRGYLGLAEERPGDWHQLNRTGDALIVAGQVARGIELCLQAARGFSDAGFDGKARAIYRKVIRLAPDDPEAQAGLFMGDAVAGGGVARRGYASLS